MKERGKEESLNEAFRLQYSVKGSSQGLWGILDPKLPVKCPTASKYRFVILALPHSALTEIRLGRCGPVHTPVHGMDFRA